jgi:hypothetical protein
MLLVFLCALCDLCGEAFAFGSALALGFALAYFAYFAVNAFGFSLRSLRPLW